MTRLVKRVQRTTERIASARTEVVVTLYPEGTIGFRLKHQRHEVITSLEACYWLACKAAAQDQTESSHNRGSRHCG